MRNGGRYVPAEAIRLAAAIAEALARSDWTAILQHRTTAMAICTHHRQSRCSGPNGGTQYAASDFLTGA